MLRLVIMTKARVASDMAVEEHHNTQYKCVTKGQNNTDPYMNKAAFSCSVQLNESYRQER